jgi:2',3'-cyclic-nucleotide 2'-phosphodiesterase (5'-nucleotidase family)
LGGLSKKIFQINKLSEGQITNRLLLDSGNLLFDKATIAEGPNQARLTASAILDIYQSIGYDAVAVGPLDLAGGLSLLHDPKRKHFPWISANIIDSNGQPIFNQIIRKKIQDKDIIITAISAAPVKNIPGIQLLPWEAVLPGLIEEIKQENKDSFIILLSTLNNDENIRIAKTYPEVQIILGADSQQGNIIPQLTEETIITQTTQQGKYQALLQIKLGNTRVWGKEGTKKLADLQNRLGAINWQHRRLQKKVNNSTSETNKYTASLTRLEDEKEEITAQIKLLEEQVAKEKESGTIQDHFTYQFISLKKNLPDDAKTVERVQQLTRQIRELHSKVRFSSKSRTGKISSELTPKALVGSKICASCHDKQSTFWQSTRHARAYTTLVEKGKQMNLDCLSCHLTMEVKNGQLELVTSQVLLSYPEEMQAVGCETCHGSGKRHTKEPELFRMTRKPIDSICLTCHTEEHDDNFIYLEKLQRISCPVEQKTML